MAKAVDNMTLNAYIDAFRDDVFEKNNEDKYTGEDNHRSVARETQMLEETNEDVFDQTSEIVLNDNDTKLAEKIIEGSLDYDTLSDKDKASADTLEHLLGVKTLKKIKH